MGPDYKILKAQKAIALIHMQVWSGVELFPNASLDIQFQLPLQFRHRLFFHSQ